MQPLDVLDKEIVEALHNLLDRLEVELHSSFVVLPDWSLDCEIDVLKHREDYLTEDFPPEIQIERLNSVLKYLEQCLH